MQLTDILPIEKWVELEKMIVERYGVDSNVFNVDGVRVSGFKAWANDLCPAIKATDKGQSFICAVAHMNLAAQAMQTRQAVVEECDAGLVKIVVPILLDGLFLGAVGACGVLFEDGEVDTFLIDKITEIAAETVAQLSGKIRLISNEKALELSQFVQDRIDKIIAAHKQNPHRGSR
jgi:ligand-binding sensor protein